MVVKASELFNLSAGIILFLMGCGLIAKNVFFDNIQNGYELLFSLELITGGIFLVHGKFKGFKSSGDREE